MCAFIHYYVCGCIGETAIKTGEEIRKASGGTILIDEAYELTPPDASRDFGQEAVEEVMKSISGDAATAIFDDRPAFIFAGYREDMERFLNSNKGLQRRITDFFLFENYSSAQLIDILFLMANKEKFTFEIAKVEAVAVLSHHISIETMARHNAGIAIKVLSECKSLCNKRVAALLSGKAAKEAIKKEIQLLRKDEFTTACESVKSKLAMMQ